MRWKALSFSPCYRAEPRQERRRSGRKTIAFIVIALLFVDCWSRYVTDGVNVYADCSIFSRFCHLQMGFESSNGCIGIGAEPQLKAQASGRPASIAFDPFTNRTLAGYYPGEMWFKSRHLIWTGDEFGLAFYGFVVHSWIDQSLYRPPCSLSFDRTWFVAFPDWVLLLIPVVCVSQKTYRSRRAAWREAHMLCIECGYPLRVANSGCPECGTGMAMAKKAEVNNIP
jgi:hypothetical protein